MQFEEDPMKEQHQELVRREDARKRRLANRKYLLRAQDGPESIEIYTSDSDGYYDQGYRIGDIDPAIYISVTTQHGSFQAGPFEMSEIYSKLKEQLKEL